MVVKTDCLAISDADKVYAKDLHSLDNLANLVSLVFELLL